MAGRYRSTGHRSGTGHHRRHLTGTSRRGTLLRAGGGGRPADGGAHPAVDEDVDAGDEAGLGLAVVAATAAGVMAL
jgi:hypothetical protein